MNNQNITVNLIPNLSAPAVACVSQYDVGRPLVFRVYNGVTSADLTDTTAVAVGTKKSGLGFSVTGTISGNTVTFNSTLEMTQESGMIPAEIRFSKTGEDIGTANFTLAVEPSPHLEGTTDGTTETMADLQSQLDALDERVEALEGGGGGGGLTDAIKSALLQIAQKVAYIDEYGQTYYNALYNALYPPADLVSISAVYTQSGTVYDTDTLDSLRSDLVVTAHMSDSTTRTVTDYTLSGTLEEGTSTITVSYGGKTDTFDVTVTSSRPSNPYVTDNMTLWLDGIINTATGHDASATTWTNLIDNTQLTNVGITVGSDGMIFDGTAGHGFLGTAVSSPTTIEIVLDVTNPATTQAVINGYGNSDNGNISIKSSSILQKRGNYADGQTHTISTGLHTHTFVAGDAHYVDGVVATQGSATISFSATGALAIGNSLSANSQLATGSSAYPFTGTIKCIRFYSDALTAQEVASNFAIDATRFGIS